MNKIWDVAVIGGGPAGMMAAARAAEKGASVILIEKNKTLGKKLLTTGGGRCNVTNAEFDTRKLLSKFKKSDKFLFSPFSQWNVQQTLDFFHAKNMPTKIEVEMRVFPASNTAQSVWSVLVAYMNEHNVTVLSNSPVVGITAVDGTITHIDLKNGKSIRAKSFIIATGGASHPETGSTGDGFKWLGAIGHSINVSRAALVPVALKDAWTHRLAGVSLKDVKITLYQNDAKQGSDIGKMLFTHVGVSGPMILNASREIGELLKYGQVVLELDLLPAQGYEKVNALLQDIFKTHAKKKIKNSLGSILPPALVPVLLERSHIDPEIFCSSATREMRIRLMKLLKHFRMEVKGLLGEDKAIVTSGGVPLTEVDTKTMRSRLFSNLYLVGDMLDIERPSGGYSLQLCWTTGFVAGSSAA